MVSTRMLLALSIGLLLNDGVLVESKPSFPAKIPNGANVPGVAAAAIGHVNKKGGGALNAFGLAFQSAKFKWTKELCKEDSDDDGLTNGEELGDPCCLWSTSASDSVLRVDDLSNPGDPDSVAKAAKSTAKHCSSSSSSSSLSKNTTTTTTAPGHSTVSKQQHDNTTNSQSSALTNKLSVGLVCAGVVVAILSVGYW